MASRPWNGALGDGQAQSGQNHLLHSQLGQIKSAGAWAPGPGFLQAGVDSGMCGLWALLLLAGAVPLGVGRAEGSWNSSSVGYQARAFLPWGMEIPGLAWVQAGANGAISTWWE
jgi:hypothetical protein